MSVVEGVPLASGQSQDASTPALSERLGDVTPRAGDVADEPKKEKGKKRALFGLGKKKNDGQDTPKLLSKSGSSTSGAAPTVSRDMSKLSSTSRSTTSPTGEHTFILPTSPNRGLSGSPRLSSPAGSQIFERDVQDSVVMPKSPAIPSHIQTENHIPPALDASSEAITDDHLDPDSVEIITHSQHQPAAVTVTGAGAGNSPLTYEQLASSWAEDFGSLDRDDVSSYGAFDGTDVRRLSFISFADVVQAEQAGHGGNRESVHIAGLTSFANVNRSPSPIRSPVSSQGPGTSPPTSKSGSMKGVEVSPTRKPLGSPILTHHNLAPSDINVETMSQALRRTGSADLSAHRSLPTSPVDGPSR